MAATISIIIPTLNEADSIGRAIESCSPETEDVEVIVVDAGSTDKTGQKAVLCGAKVITAELGRSPQMNAGAQNANGDLLLFLHADTTLPESFRSDTREVANRRDFIAGAFRLGIEASGLAPRAVERMVNLRSRFLEMPYGDQAIFLKRSTFLSVGGYPSIPIMEDFELIRRLRQMGRIFLARSSVSTSARRWEQRGYIRTTMINRLIIAGYLLGLSPHRLSNLYGRPSGFKASE